MKIFRKFFIIFMTINLVFSQITNNITDRNYCAFNVLCYPYTHIGCLRSKNFLGPSCSFYRNVSIIRFASVNSNYIVDLHNNYRNKVALGRLTGFPRAARMPTVKWDPTLAYLAELNVRQCFMKHDNCRSTNTYIFSGQNLCIASSYDENLPMQTFLFNCHDFWFSEHTLISQSIINRYMRAPSDIEYGHFTQMVVDRSTALGCGMSKYYDAINEIYYYLLACNYASSNVIGFPIYRAMQSKSSCLTGQNPRYPGLCNSSENINPNIIF